MNSIKDNEILKEIENGQLELAQHAIQALESKLKGEKLKYNQKILRERIETLKSAFSIASQKNTVLEVEQKEICNLKINKSTKNINSTEIRGERNKTIEILPATQITIVDCDKIETQYFKCDESLSIRQTCNSKFICSAKQVRLFQCRNVKLVVFTETGVFIEECTGIRISRLDIKEDNKENLYDRVYDFSDFTANNYEIV